MASLLSNLVINLAEKLHETKCKRRHINKKCETYGIKYKDSECCLEHKDVKDDLIVYKYLCCAKNFQKN